MILVFGGLAQGKTKYIKDSYPHKSYVSTKFDLNTIFDFDIIDNFDTFVMYLELLEIDPVKFIKENINKLTNKIIIGNEIGQGIAPILKIDRTHRDNVGFVYQILVEEANKVYRMWNGIPLLIKGERNEN